MVAATSIGFPPFLCFTADMPAAGLAPVTIPAAETDLVITEEQAEMATAAALALTTVTVVASISPITAEDEAHISAPPAVTSLVLTKSAIMVTLSVDDEDVEAQALKSAPVSHVIAAPGFTPATVPRQQIISTPADK